MEIKKYNNNNNNNHHHHHHHHHHHIRTNGNFIDNKANYKILFTIPFD